MSRAYAVISAFSQHFVKTGRVPRELHRDLVRGQAVRHGGDYGRRGTVTHAQAETQIRNAEEFLRLAEQLIGGQQP